MPELLESASEQRASGRSYPRRLRNFVAHECQRIDYEIVWNPLERRLPNEMARIRRRLGSPSELSTCAGATSRGNTNLLRTIAKPFHIRYVSARCRRDFKDR